MKDLTNKEKYQICEFVFAYEGDTLIKSECRDIVNILHSRVLINGNKATELLEKYKKPHEKKQEDFVNVDEYLAFVAESITVEKWDAELMYNILRTEIKDEEFKAMWNEYVSGQLG